jgi:tRNA threonylcarbamoyladenosine biosynthesis protein TsaE
MGTPAPVRVFEATPEFMPARRAEITLPDEAATQRLGAALAAAIVAHAPLVEAAGGHIGLSGGLGTGKTALVRAMLRALGIRGPVRSPTFTLLEPYTVSRLNLYHLDLYRFASEQEFTDAGFRDLFGAARIVLVEWPERAQTKLPPTDLDIHLALPASIAPDDPDTVRIVTLVAHGATGAAWLTHPSLAALCRGAPAP